mgnify:CR=1 FL=1
MITTKNINFFENKIGYIFKNKEILISSLLHPSYIKEKKIKYSKLNQNFERLEFLGDRVLGLVIASLIFSKFKDLNEGDLSKKLSYLVQKNFLYKISNELTLIKVIKYRFKKQNEKMNQSVFADTVESIIGAIYLDGGYQASTKFIKKFWGPYLNTKVSSILDSKTKLQEISQKKYKKLPMYKLISRSGPSHLPNFTVSLKVLNLKKITAKGSSIREAEKNAAVKALELLNEEKIT